MKFAAKLISFTIYSIWNSLFRLPFKALIQEPLSAAFIVPLGIITDADTWLNIKYYDKIIMHNKKELIPSIISNIFVLPKVLVSIIGVGAFCLAQSFIINFIKLPKRIIKKNKKLFNKRWGKEEKNSVKDNIANNFFPQNKLKEATSTLNQPNDFNSSNITQEQLEEDGIVPFIIIDNELMTTPLIASKQNSDFTPNNNQHHANIKESNKLK